MLALRDRRDWGLLALTLLLWGMFAAPLLHLATAHAHGHAHTHGAPAVPGVPHGEGSLEHFSAAFFKAAAAPLLLLVLVRVVRPALALPNAPDVEPFGSVALAQGP